MLPADINVVPDAFTFPNITTVSSLFVGIETIMSAK
jgi:hypothetical protein